MKKSELTKTMRWRIAEQLAQDRLPSVNRSCADVTPKVSLYTRYGKRVLDILIALLALIVTAPVNLLLAVCTFFDVGKPIFFRQERLGKNGKIFKITKFRNMRNTRDERGELLPPEMRVTPFGKFVRKTSLDELLNFWCVLKGDMSIIGPRPLVPEYALRFSRRHAARMAVRPGLECPPRNDLNHVWTWQEQFENDVWYVEHVSFLTDCHMFWQLVKFTFNRKSADARAVAARGTFMGYSADGTAINMDDVPQSYIDAYGDTRMETPVSQAQKE